MILGFGEDLEQEASFTEGWGMEVNGSFSEESPEKSPSSSRSRKRKSATESRSPLTVVITKRSKTEIKEEVVSDLDEEEEEEEMEGKVKKEQLDEDEDEEVEEKRGSKDSEFVIRLPRASRPKSGEGGDEECYQLRGGRAGRRWGAIL